MSLKKKIAPVLAITLAFGLVAGTIASADDDDHHDRGNKRAAAAKAPESPLYKQECSSCHFLYQPWLLPARSWKVLLDESDKHFGDNLALDDETKKELLAYLSSNSSERFGSRWAQKITSSSEGTTPKRIMDVPWIKKEHREVGASVFKRPSIGSASNCGACHTKGAEGNFEEDYVRVPKN